MNTKKKGFTLIELIVSIALLGILGVTFLTIFSGSMLNIINTGKRSNDHYTGQENMEKIIYDSANATGPSTSTNKTLDITFGSPGVTYHVSGRQIDVPCSGTQKFTSFTID